MTVYGFCDLFVDPEFQQIKAYSLDKFENVFEGTADELMENDSLGGETVWSIDCLDENSDGVITINIGQVLTNDEWYDNIRPYQQGNMVELANTNG